MLRYETKLPTGQVIQVCQGDLTQEECDAIVNPANSYLEHGGGVAGAIVRRGGQIIQAESDQWISKHGKVATGQVALTGGGNLACRVVIHAVGPVWHGGNNHEDDLLRSAVARSLLKADEVKLSSIALPAISSGIFGFPKPRCARILIETAFAFLDDHPQSSLRLVRFTNIDQETVTIFEDALKSFNQVNHDL